MKAWKIWVVTIPILLLMIAAAICIWLWRNLSTNWEPEKYAAAYVLNHTAIDHLQQYHVFTASGLEDVFEGQDAFGRSLYAFYIPTSQTVYTVPASDVLSAKRIQSTAVKLGLHSVTETLGFVTNEAAPKFGSTHSVVYEVTGVKRGQTTFVYLDAKNGHVLWQYSLSS